MTYEDINTSTAITELILKLNRGQTTRETKQDKRKRKKEERGLMPHDDRRPGFKKILKTVSSRVA